MCILPTETLHDILLYALSPGKGSQWRSPVAILTSNSLLHDISLGILYRELHFRSHVQLYSFISTYNKVPPPYAPLSAEFDFVGHDSPFLFSDLVALFSKCYKGDVKGIEKDQEGRLCLDLLRFCANTHAFGYDGSNIFTSLSHVNPRRFIWSGPDPPHHFSIAIVPAVIPYLFRALSSHTNLVYLKLTHISMTLRHEFKLPLLPSLKVFHFGQVVFLDPQEISRFVLEPGMGNLQEVRLVDAYKGSIWGSRIRRSDIEQAALFSVESQPNAPIATVKNVYCDVIRRIVVCKATTERIIGGDRAESENLI